MKQVKLFVNQNSHSSRGLKIARVFCSKGINAANNILHKGQLDCYGEKLKISQATGDMGINIPKALQKMTDKIERSSNSLLVGHRSGQAA